MRLPQRLFACLFRGMLLCRKCASGRRSISSIRVEKNNNLIITYRDGRSETHTWRDRSRAESWTPEMKKAARERARKQRSEKNAPHGGEKGATNAKNHSNPSDT